MTMRIDRATTLILAVVLCMFPALRSSALTDTKVERTIDQLKAQLYEAQDKEIGGWFGSYHAHPKENPDQQDPEKNKNLGGPTAIATLALLVSGESSQDPRLAKAIDYLRTLDMYGTYALALKVHVWSYLPDRYLDNLEQDATLLLGGSDPDRSTWRYKVYPERDKSWDNSTNQYGILGMWQYAKRGGRINPKFWENAAKHFLEVQQPSGGWGYIDRDTRATMTAAGLTCLYVVQQELFREKDKAPGNLAKAIDRGMIELDRSFAPKGGGHGGAGYGRYGYERVALASGVKYLKNQDWFEAIGSYITQQANKKPTVVNNSFDLMFLARGRVPVWCNKIALKNGPWKNRPNDIYFLSRHISKLGEHEVNWQYITLDRPLMDWLPAPVAWLSSDKAIELTDEEKKNLKKYLDLGGVLVANHEGSSEFEESIKDLAQEMYPDFTWRDVPADSALGTTIHQVDAGSTLPVKGLYNGARDLILIPDRDWGLTLQKERKLDKTVPGQIMTNLYAMASDRGNLPNRLVREFPKDSGNRGNLPKVWVAQAKFGAESKLGNPEGAAWTPLRNILGPDASINLMGATVPLSGIGGGTMIVNDEEVTISLLHISGAQHEEDYQLSEKEKAAIKAFVEGGGTVLVENVGGRTEFATNMAKQLQPLFGVGANRLTAVDTVIEGSAHAAAKSVRRIHYRKFSVITMDAGNKQRLKAIKIGDRAGVIFSDEDLSLGALGARHWGINGYTTESARQILANIVLTAKR